MKKITKILCVMLIATVLTLSSFVNVFASSISTVPESCCRPLVETIYDNEGNITGKVEYTYNKFGSVLTETGYWYFEETSSFAVSRQYTNEYDENGELIKSTTVFYDYSNPENIQNAQKTYVTYDENGNLTLQWGEYYSEGKWLFERGEKREYTLDASGRVLTSVCTRMESPTEVGDLYYKSEYTYDENGNKSQIVEYNYNSGIWNKNCKYVYKYDKNGNVINASYCYYKDEMWDEDNDIETLSKYNENNLVIERENHYEKHPAWKNLYKYDSKGRPIESIDYSPYNDKGEYTWKETSKCVITYDDAKNTYTMLDYNYTDNDWLLLQRHECTFTTIHGEGLKHQGKLPTKTEDGYKDYYSCKYCGKYFEDEYCTIEITDLEKWKAEGGNGFLARLSPKTGNSSSIKLLLILTASALLLSGASLTLGKKEKIDL